MKLKGEDSYTVSQKQLISKYCYFCKKAQEELQGKMTSFYLEQ